MKQLTEVLIDTKHTAEQSDRSNDLSNTLAHGSITEDGKMSIQSTSKQNLRENQSHSGQGRQHCEGLCLKDDAEGKKELVLLLSDCFDTMKLYGKEPEQLEALVRIFKRVLGRFTWHDIEQAFDVYLSASSEMPTPADIVGIIEPPEKKKKWCGATYVQLCKQRTQGAFMSDEELRYISDYEDAIISGDADSGAVDRAESFKKQYLLEG